MAMPALRFKQVDVFTARPYFGNPVAVVLDAAGLDTAHLRQFEGALGVRIASTVAPAWATWAPSGWLPNSPMPSQSAR
jgi:hypothetical protein